MANYGTLLYINDALASILSLFLNSILFYCVIRNWTNELRQLNLILIQNIVLDVVYSLFPITLGIVNSDIILCNLHLCSSWFLDSCRRVGIVYRWSDFCFHVGSVSYLPHQIGCVVYCIFCMMLALLVYAFAMQFYFRYRTLCRNLKVSTALQFILCIFAISVSSSIAVELMIAYKFQCDLSSYDNKTYKTISQYLIISKNTAFVVSHTSSFLLASVFGGASLTILISSALSVYYARRISQFVNYTVSLTTRFKNTYLTTFHAGYKRSIVFENVS
uniref:G protein-coupled receptor n=2 Tax=Panagrellus redivivus TaxID=6233 RepID=A0A7E4WA87_PANRE